MFFAWNFIKIDRKQFRKQYKIVTENAPIFLKVREGSTDVICNLLKENLYSMANIGYNLNLNQNPLWAKH